MSRPKSQGRRVAEARERPCPSNPVSIRCPSYPASTVSEGAGRGGLWLGDWELEMEKPDPTPVFAFGLEGSAKAVSSPSQMLRFLLALKGPPAPVPPALSGLTLLFCFSEVELPLKKDGFTSESTTLEALLRGEGVEKKLDAREEENIQEIQVFLCLRGSWWGRR